MKLHFVFLVFFIKNVNVCKKMERQNISVLGIGKLGLGFALLLEKHGYNVLGLDIHEQYISNINNKTIHFNEPYYNELLLQSKHFRATSDLNETIQFSNILFIIVQTPNGGGDKFYDHTILSNLLFKIRTCDYKNKDIIIGCTVMPGYIDQIAKTLLPDCFISYNPEFVAQGDIIDGFENSDVILLGTDNENLITKIKEIYSFSKGTFCCMKPLEAEIVKISLNGYITTKISYANMISDLCDTVGADKHIVLDAIGTDSRIGKKYFKPGYSFGGPCFPRDTRALKQLMDQNNIQSELLQATTNYNMYHIDYQVNQLKNLDFIEFENVCYKESKTVLPLIEESAKLKIAKKLKNLGKNVCIHDESEIIDEVKKEFGNLFEYKIKDSSCTKSYDSSFKKSYEYWNSRPCNIKHSDKPIGTKEYFMEVSQRKYFVESHIPSFAEFEKYTSKCVLEVGCGIGTAAQSFVEHGAFYTGIDISDYSIELAKKRFEVFDLSGTFLVHTIEEPIHNQYDLVYSFGVLHHTPDINKAIKNINTCLKPGGEFKLMLYAKNSYKYTQILSGKDQFEANSGVPIANVYTHEEVHELLKDFKDISIEQTHIFPYKIDEYKQYQYIKEEPFASMSDQEFKNMEKNLGWHLCISCKK
jgi:UDPglucose 6-dehydrogenase